MRILNTRPAPDAAGLTAALRARGHAVVEAPMLAVRPVAGAALGLDLAGVQAILATSANGVRAFADARPERGLPLFAVGDATARAARAAGFEKVFRAGGDVEALAATVREEVDPGAGALLHVAGSVVAGDLAGSLGGSGFDVRRAVLYAAEVPAALPAAAAEGLTAGTIDAIVLFSPRTARTFVDLVVAAGLAGACRAVVALCLSPAVAAVAATVEWRAVRTAARPEQDALLDLVSAGREP